MNERPELPLVRTQAEVEAMWRLLMSPLGFGGHTIWMVVVQDDRPLPRIVEIVDLSNPRPARTPTPSRDSSPVSCPHCRLPWLPGMRKDGYGGPHIGIGIHSGGACSMDVRRILAGLCAVPLLVLTLALAACGSGSSSVADPPVSSAPTTSTTTHAPQRESPEHFIRRWVSASNAMERRGNTLEYLRLTRHCRPCIALAKQISIFNAHGGFYRSNGWKIRRLHVSSGTRDPSVEVDVLSAPTLFKRSTDAPVQRYSGGRLRFQISVGTFSGSWLVTNVAQIAQ